MSLKLRLKPGEKVIIGRAVISNGPKASEFSVENNIPILRQRDIMTEKDADSPARRVYFVVQLMYINEESIVEYHNTFWELAGSILTAAPSTKTLIEKISERILARDYYQALKITRKLIDYEKELIDHVKQSA